MQNTLLNQDDFCFPAGNGIGKTFKKAKAKYVQQP